MPKLRVDFIFYYFHESKLGMNHSNQYHSLTSAGVIDNVATKMMSDHFPVHFSYTRNS